MNIQKYIVIIVFFIVLKSYSQDRYITKEGFVSFFSNTIVEDIKADNFQVLSVMDKQSGEIAIQILMKDENRK